MTTTNCTNCNKYIDTHVRICPHCGKERRAQRDFRLEHAMSAVFVLFNVAMVAWTAAAIARIREGAPDATNLPAVAGYAAGTATGLITIYAIWLLGAVVLGFAAVLSRA